MERSCYCCDKELVKYNQRDLSALDAALNELGMLSVTTDSRLQYLKEMSRKRCSSVSLPRGKSNPSDVKGGFCFLHMQKKYVTNIVPRTSADDMAVSCSKQRATQTDPVPNCSRDDLSPLCLYEDGVDGVSKSHPCSLKMRPSRTRLRFLKPYEFPWHNHLEERVKTMSLSKETARIRPSTSSSPTPTPVAGPTRHSQKAVEEPSTTTASSCNRSNPSSPSKPSRPSTGGGMLRSRSWDNLASVSWEKNGGSHVDGFHNKEDIENVSQQMKDLKVN